MPTALDTVGLPSQPHQGAGVRFVRRLAGAVRSAVISGITLAAALRPLAVSSTTPDYAPAQNPQSPSAPRQARVPRRPSASLPAPSLPRWLASLLTRRHHQFASVSRPAYLNQADAPFTPQAYPQLSPQACAVLNTPLQDCDPKTLELLLSAFAQHISDLASPEAGMTDPRATLPNLWQRISTVLNDTKTDTSWPATPDTAPATATDAVPLVPVLSPHPPAHSPPTGPTTASAKDASRPSPVPLAGPPASDHPADATITAPAPQTTPEIAAPSVSVVHGSRALSNRGRSFRSYTQPSARWCRSPFRCCRALFPPGVRDGLPCLPPPWRLYYAACTGPP
jgi:hypothetical protein